MKKKSNSLNSINLLKSQRKDIVNTAINWLLTIGRLMVILVELVALSAFLYRFSLDRQIIDLNSRIKQQEAILKLLKNNEIQYRDLQERLSLASDFSSGGISKVKIFQDIAKAAQDLAINSLSVLENKITINVFTQTTSSLNTFTNSLKAYPQIAKLNLDSISVKKGSGLTVTFTAIIE